MASDGVRGALGGFDGALFGFGGASFVVSTYSMSDPSNPDITSLPLRALFMFSI